MKRGSSDAKRPAGPKTLPARAGHIFKISVERFLAAKEVEEGRAKEVAEKMWQASQSNHEKSDNFQADLNNWLLAIKKCWWAKAKEDTAPLWAEKK